MIDNLLKQSESNKILKDSTIDNKESVINDILNKKTIKNDNSYVKTPASIRYKKAVLSLRTNDNKSFQYSITLSLYQKEIGNNSIRTTKINLYN